MSDSEEEVTRNNKTNTITHKQSISEVNKI